MREQSVGNGTRPVTRKALRLGIGLSLVFALAAPLASFALLFPMVDNVPAWDQWSMIEVWEAHYQGRPVLPLLLKPYGYHLNVIPRALFYGLGLITHWNVRIEVLVTFLLAACTTVALLVMLRDSGEGFLLLAAPFSAVVFSLAHYVNYLSGYPMGQVLSQCACTLMVLVLTRPRIGARHLAAGAAAAAVATFSWGAGLAAWPVGLAAVVFRLGKRRGVAAVWCAFTLVCALIVKRGAGAPGHVGFKTILDFDTPFFLALLGRLFTHRAFPDFAAAVSMGLIVLLAFILTLEEALRARHWLLGLRWGLLGTMALLAAALITQGRANIGPQQALQSHYSTATYPLALSALALGSHALLFRLSMVRSKLQRAGATLVLAALVSLPVVMVLAQSREMLAILRIWVPVVQMNNRKLLAGTITDDEIRSSLHPDTELVRRGTSVLREHRLAAFADLPPQR